MKTNNPSVFTAILAFFAFLGWTLLQGIAALMLILAWPFLLLGHALIPRTPRHPHR